MCGCGWDRGREREKENKKKEKIWEQDEDREKSKGAVVGVMGILNVEEILTWLWNKEKEIKRKEEKKIKNSIREEGKCCDKICRIIATISFFTSSKLKGLWLSVNFWETFPYDQVPVFFS